jgi:hypothetical protein
MVDGYHGKRKINRHDIVESGVKHYKSKPEK